jgi:hypothetical protein
MTAIGLQIIALVAVVLSFLFAALVFTSSQLRHANTGPSESPSGEGGDDSGEADDTMARVLADIERLATLRERGVLTDKEFAMQKTKLLQNRS